MTRIPAGKYLFGPINRLIGVQPKKVCCDQSPEAERAMWDWRKLIHEYVKEPTNVKELGWIVLKAITGVRLGHMGICSNNSPTVA